MEDGENLRREYLPAWVASAGEPVYAKDRRQGETP